MRQYLYNIIEIIVNQRRTHTIELHQWPYHLSTRETPQSMLVHHTIDPWWAWLPPMSLHLWYVTTMEWEGSIVQDQLASQDRFRSSPIVEKMYLQSISQRISWSEFCCTSVSIGKNILMINHDRLRKKCTHTQPTIDGCYGSSRPSDRQRHPSPRFLHGEGN